MKTFKQILEGAYFEPEPGQKLNWSEFMHMSPKDREKTNKKTLKKLKLKRNKDPRSKAQRIGVTLDSYETQDGKYRLDMVGSHYKVTRAGKSKPVWKIWNANQPVPQYGGTEFNNLKQAKDGLLSILMRTGAIDIIA